MCASVSGFCTSVGRRRRPRSNGLERRAAEVADQGGLLAGEIRDRHRRDRHVACITPLRDRALQRRARGRGIARDRDHDRPCADRGGRGDRAVEHQVRCNAHQHAILRAHRLALGTVDEHALGTTARRDAAQLDPRRE
jgi:hypothetical protein